MSTPSFSGSTRGGSSGVIRTRANSVRSAGREQPGQFLQARLVLDLHHALDAAAARHLQQIDAAAGVARLHAGLAIEAVVEHDDGEVAGLLHADGGEAAEPHQHLAVAGDDGDARVRLRQRKTEPDHRRAAHRAPEIEVAVVVAGGEGVPGAGAEPRHDEQILRPVGEQGGHRGAAFEHHFTHTLRPISFCDSSTAAARSSPNASCSAFCTAGTTCSASRPWRRGCRRASASARRSSPSAPARD